MGEKREIAVGEKGAHPLQGRLAGNARPLWQAKAKEKKDEIGASV